MMGMITHWVRLGAIDLEGIGKPVHFSLLNSTGF